MKTRGKMIAQEAIFSCRIYSIFLAVLFWCLCFSDSLSQEIGSYRTISSGNFGNIGIWEVYDGTVWTPAVTKPTLVNDIYIDQTHKVTLTGNEEVKSLLINAETGAGEKLNLNGRNLNLYGSLQAFDGAAPGVPAGTWNSQNWIGNSLTSTITFKGNSRIIVPKDAWSGFSTQSRYSVIFDPGPGIQLTVEEAFKALSFTIRSGTVIQQIDTSVNPGKCATFSFNNENSVAVGVYGNFTIESGGILLSKCNSDILFRSETLSANLFDLQAGGELILEGTSPQMEAANFLLDGKVTFNKNSGTQNFISKSYASSELPLTFHDLEIQGSQNVALPATLSISGNMAQVGTGAFDLTNTTLNLIESGDQTIYGFAMNIQNLTVNKPSGTAFFEENLTVNNNLKMDAGGINLQGNTLTLNTLGAGGLEYNAGHWVDLGQFTYQNVPTSLNATNATFPFYDQYQGGIRKVQMLGTNAGGNLNMQFTEYKGADFNASFNDLDGTPILYRLFSYFNFSGLNSSSNPLELRISADKLIVDEPEDLRLVCTGYAAPGNHIESTDAINLWAIRSLTFDDLPGKNFTVGSFRTLSILPVTWLTLSAKTKDNVKQISWSVAAENENEKFEIYSSDNPLKKWYKIGEVLSQGNSDSPVFYSYSDKSFSNSTSIYYQIRLIDLSGQWSWSNVVRLENRQTISKDQISISPNPHYCGKIHISIPDGFTPENAHVDIYATQGHLISSFSYNEFQLTEKLEMLTPGLYIISFSTRENVIQSRWIKR
ncbi:T9SS type A sorting domain-containing protein [Algoriphagus sp. D3-2-R+10]|uniref:T9SS type A sorting domain-containing protein n=1 Tax=Algoriphagus aurantiacus TaxID=3103948 RepID=UPI002B3CB97C|nr:T9SS type A sorting domain-containing protein [Algoriphagus sp. D3-2-R+10]MEB2778455.1 T9SS type A sorting domain-containing protein [Algoriphagus sp. D3-2-R+10]